MYLEAIGQYNSEEGSHYRAETCVTFLASGLKYAIVVLADELRNLPIEATAVIAFIADFCAPCCRA
jgi:hypothetical protein